MHAYRMGGETGKGEKPEDNLKASDGWNALEFNPTGESLRNCREHTSELSKEGQEIFSSSIVEDRT